MIEINLIPDVKRELIRAKRARTYVISGAVLAGIVSVGLVVLMVVILGVQNITVQSNSNAIKDNSAELLNDEGLPNLLTIQHQLTKISEYHNEKNMYSRLFDLLSKINTDGKNLISFSKITADDETGTVRIEAQTRKGYPAADVLKKTIQNTTFSYVEDDQTYSDVLLASDVILTDMSYGTDAEEKLSLQFTITFSYDPLLFARSSEDATVSGLGKKDVTDSYLGLNGIKFSDRASDTKETN